MNILINFWRKTGEKINFEKNTWIGIHSNGIDEGISVGILAVIIQKTPAEISYPQKKNFYEKNPEILKETLGRYLRRISEEIISEKIIELTEF